MSFFGSYKVVRSGHIIDIYKYDRSACYDRESGEFLSREGGRDKKGKEERKNEYRATVAHRRYTKLINIINANFDEDSLFVTLTFKEDIGTDVTEAAYQLKKFVQKMKRRQEDFKSVTVVELGKKNGRLHLHMLCNIRGIEWRTLAELQAHERTLGGVWGCGWVDIGYKKNDNAGAYLVKYMTKDNIDSRLDGKKRYFCHGKLEKPEAITGKEALEIIKEVKGLPPAYSSEYYSEFHGKVQRLQYNPKRYDVNQFFKRQEEQEQEFVDNALKEFGDLVEVGD